MKIYKAKYGSYPAFDMPDLASINQNLQLNVLPDTMTYRCLQIDGALVNVCSAISPNGWSIHWHEMGAGGNTIHCSDGSPACPSCPLPWFWQLRIKIEIKRSPGDSLKYPVLFPPLKHPVVAAGSAPEIPLPQNQRNTLDEQRPDLVQAVAGLILLRDFRQWDPDNGVPAAFGFSKLTLRRLDRLFQKRRLSKVRCLTGP